MENELQLGHLESFWTHSRAEATNSPEGHEQPVRAVGGQVEVHGVSWLPSMLTKLV